MSLQSYVSSLFKPVQCPDQSGDSSVNRNFAKLGTAFAGLGSKIDAAIESAIDAAIAALPVPVTPVSPRKYVGQATGAAPWSFTGLNGNAAGLVGYEIVGRVEDAGAGTIIGLQFNGDTAANYGDISGAPKTSARVIVGGGGATLSTAVINIPVAASGFPRNLTALAPSSDAVPEILAAGMAAFVWFGTANITRMDLVEVTGGPVTSAVFKLYELRDVT